MSKLPFADYVHSELTVVVGTFEAAVIIIIRIRIKVQN